MSCFDKEALSNWCRKGWENVTPLWSKAFAYCHTIGQNCCQSSSPVSLLDAAKIEVTGTWKQKNIPITILKFIHFCVYFLLFYFFGLKVWVLQGDCKDFYFYFFWQKKWCCNNLWHYSHSANQIINVVMMSDIILIGIVPFFL